MKKRNRIELGPHDALVLVDLQNDFFDPDGALAVPGSLRIIRPINRAIQYFSIHASPDGDHAGMIVATKDWHEGQHPDYPWPLHCIQYTWGAEFHPDLLYPYDLVFYKGYVGGRGSGYSGFDAVLGRKVPKTVGPAISLAETKVVLYEARTLERELRDAGIRRLFVVGLATDYCVKATVLDGLRLGFEVCVVTDAIAAVKVNPDDGEKALQEMVAAGAVLCTSSNILHEEGCEGCEECNT